MKEGRSLVKVRGSHMGLVTRKAGDLRWNVFMINGEHKTCFAGDLIFLADVGERDAEGLSIANIVYKYHLEMIGRLIEQVDELEKSFSQLDKLQKGLGETTKKLQSLEDQVRLLKRPL